MNIIFKRTAFFQIEIFCSIINVFTVTFDQFNAMKTSIIIIFLIKLLILNL